MIKSSHHGRAAVHSDGNAEIVSCRPIGRRQLGLLAPGCAALHEHIRRTLVCVGADHVMRGSHHDRAAVHRDGITKPVIWCAVGRGQFLLLTPRSAAFGEHISGSGTT